MLAITNTAIFTPDRQIDSAAILIADGRFQQIISGQTPSLPADAQVIDGSGLLAVPGFIELQINGAFGHDFTADPHTIWQAAASLPRYGITTFLPTVITSPLPAVEAARKVILEERPFAFSGAEPLGLHIEGPFINPQKKGAHNPAYIQDPDPALVKAWSPEGGVRLVTLAPERNGALAMAADLAARNVVVSAGHSMATYDEAQAGFAAGIRYATHLFNAMPALNHREPGLPGAVLDSPEIVSGLIVDGIHVHPALVRQIWLAKGSRGLSLVSDAMAALGMPPGDYILNDHKVTVTETECRLADGTLAGAMLSLDQAMRNLIAFTGCSLPEALATISSTPARLLGIENERGSITPGLIADLVLLTPDLQIAATIANGRIVHQLATHPA